MGVVCAGGGGGRGGGGRKVKKKGERENEREIVQSFSVLYDLQTFILSCTSYKFYLVIVFP